MGRIPMARRNNIAALITILTRAGRVGSKPLAPAHPHPCVDTTNMLRTAGILIGATILGRLGILTSVTFMGRLAGNDTREGMYRL